MHFCSKIYKWLIPWLSSPTNVKVYNYLNKLWWGIEICYIGFSATWIEPMVVINSQPWGIVYWLVFKRLPVQTTYLFLQAFLKYFYSQEMLTTSEIKFKLHLILTLSVQLQTIMTFYEENYGQNELNLQAWSDVHACL